MTDYAEFREANRDPAFIRTTDPHAVRRSGTHYSHGSVTASTRSWVYSTQQNPPPPPEPIPLPSPVRTYRPLPEPNLQPQHPVYYVTNGGPEDEEEEYMNIDPNADGVDIGYRTEGLGRGRFGKNTSSRPDETDNNGSRSFVGGFVRGLKKIPKVVLGYGGSGEKRKFFRRGTLGTEGTATSVTGMTGNTLPKYTSNPSTPVGGPSNTQYFQDGQMHAPSTTTPRPQPATYTPTNSQRRRHPSFRVTPPSEVIEQEETELEYVSESHAAPPFPTPAIGSQDGERATVLIYQDPQPDLVSPPSRPPSTPLRRSDSTPIRRSGSHRQPSDAPSANQAQAQAQAHVQVQAQVPPSEVQSPVLAHPLPTSDYRKMGSLLSPTSHTQTLTTTTTTFTSEPSFSSELNPVKRFFSTLYHMPWIARDRVTVDYRPGGGRGARRGVVKKPMASWYKGTPGVVTSAKTGSGSLDLLSAGSESKRESAATGATPLASPIPERVKHRSSDRHRHHKRDRHHHHHHHRDRDRRRERRSRRRDTFSTGATAAEIQHLRSTSPIVPTAYPYPYPYPYAAAYQSFPTPHTIEPAYSQSQLQPQSQSQSAPRGPRTHRGPPPTFPHGYVPYQPAPPPPMYVIHSSSSPAQTHTQGSGGGSPDVSLGQVQGQMLSPVYMQMQLVPGSFNPETTSSPVAKPAAEPVAEA